MRVIVSSTLGAGLVVAGCVAPPPSGPRPPIVLRTQTDVPAAAVSTGESETLSISPAMIAMTLISGPASPWGMAFPKLADAALWSRFGWNGLLDLPPVDPGLAHGSAWQGVSGLSNGGLGAAVPVPNWDPRRAWASAPGGGLSMGGMTLMEAPPGWGSRGWGPAGGTDSSTWGKATAPGMYNLSRGAADVGGWGLDTGFFSIPQEEKRRQMDAYLQQVDASPNGRPGQGQTRLDQSKFPYLRPVKGPLIPDK